MAVKRRALLAQRVQEASIGTSPWSAASSAPPVATRSASSAGPTSTTIAGQLHAKSGKRVLRRPAGVGGSVLHRPASVRSPAVKHDSLPVGSRAIAGQLTECELATIQPSTAAAYSFYDDLFTEWKRLKGRNESDATIEANLLDYLDEMMADSIPLTQAEKTVAAALYHRAVDPLPQRPRLKRALKGYRKRLPPRSRNPLPKPIKSAIVMLLLAAGYRFEATYVEATYVGMTRPGELAKALARDLVRPGQGRGAVLACYSITIAPQERLAPSKTQTFDDTVIFQDPSWIGPELAALASRRGKDQPLFEVDLVRLAKLFKKCAVLLGLPLSTTMYQLRHGRASDLLLTRAKTREEVKAIGRWNTDSSVRRYGKPGKLQEQLNALSSENRAFCEWADSNLEAVFRGREAPKVPPHLRDRISTLVA